MALSKSYGFMALSNQQFLKLCIPGTGIFLFLGDPRVEYLIRSFL